MDFGVIPPEINSARMYTGPGPGSLMASSQAWTELAAELHIAAESCWSTVSSLTEGAWLGPSSLAMAAAAAPYVVWLTATATQAEQTAGQANAAASAYESALAQTVPPALVAANRSTVATLIASNVLGQNAPVIAASEAAYYEMWAQDATAMYGYASSSAAATAVKPFASPPPTSGQAERAAAAVAKSSASAAADTAESTAPQLLSAVPAVLQDLASPTVLGSTTETLSLVTGLNLLSYPGRFATFPLNFLSKALGFSKSAAAPAAAAATGAAPAAVERTGPLELSNVAPAISASLGQARIAGPMSVPHSWSGLAPLPSSPAAIPRIASLAPAGTPPAGVSASTPVMPVVANSGRSAVVSTPRYDLRPTVIPRSPAAG